MRVGCSTKRRRQNTGDELVTGIVPCQRNAALLLVFARTRPIEFIDWISCLAHNETLKGRL
jgi:hypothetical protein